MLRIFFISTPHRCVLISCLSIFGYKMVSIQILLWRTSEMLTTFDGGAVDPRRDAV